MPRYSWSAIVLPAAVVCITVAFTQSPQPDKKQLEAQARQLVAEGKALEAQGKLAEAEDKYIDAEAIIPSGDTLSAIERVHEAEKQQAQSFSSDAQNAFSAGKFPDCIHQLQQALAIEPGNAAFEHDVALCYLKQGDRANASLYLDMAIGGTADEKEKTRLLELRSSIVMGTPQPAPDADPARRLGAFDDNFERQDRNPDDTKDSGGSLCQQTAALKADFPNQPAIVFNAAKCAEEDARQGDAAQELAGYIKLAPDALDRGDALALEQSWQSLAALPGDTGQAVRRHFANASRYLDYRRYDRAAHEYEDAAKALPTYAEIEWRLGLIYESYGDVSRTQEHMAAYERLETDAARKAEADIHASSMSHRRQVYDANISDAEDILDNLLTRAMGISSEGTKHKTHLTHRQWRWASARYKQATRATEKLPQPYVERELSRAREDLDSAALLFPLGAEANEMLALIYLEGNNWAEAYRAYDAVAAQGFPVSFYAQESSGSDTKMVRATKVEIGADNIRLVYLTSYDSNKQITIAPDQSAGEDDLGNLVVNAANPPDPHAEARTIKVDEIKGIETENNFVVLKLTNESVYLAPLNVLSDIPFEGGSSRIFGNEYTRMFIRYLGYEDARLGKEGMTTGEKFKLGIQIARIGVGVGMMGMGAPMAYGSAIRSVQLIHALNIFRSVVQGVRAVNIADAAERLVDDLQESRATLERTTAEERRAVEGIPFKFIPSQPVPLRFRDKL